MDLPFWRKQHINQEPVLFIEEQGSCRGTILFHLDKVNSVEIWDESRGLFTSVPVESLEILQKNYTIQIRAKAEKVPSLQKGEEIKPIGSPDGYSATRDGTHWLLFSETGLFHKMQVRISYSHQDAWTGFVPVPSPTKLPATKEKLAAGDPLDIFVFGDSISTGANCSKSLNLAPHSASYPELMVQLVHERFPSSGIRLKNESVGGQSSEWGIKQLPKILKQAGDFRFDLNIIAWGMNDASGRRPTKRYLRNVAKHVKIIRRKNPAAEFIVVGSSLPNSSWSGAQPEVLYSYMEGLEEFERAGGPTIEFADLTTLWRDILARKNYYDLTGNGLNHPNDFGHILYAQVLATILGLYL